MRELSPCGSLAGLRSRTVCARELRPILLFPDERLARKQAMTSTFDASASTFERFRPLPPNGPEAIRAAIWSAAGLSGPVRVLDIGAGTGRIGKAFVAAGDAYTGIDTSLGMLREFPIDAPDCTLEQADARHLPFAAESFDVVLMMQVLSSVEDWQQVLLEARRVLRGGGCIAVGHSVSPESGIDSQLKRQLKRILEEMQMESFRPEQSRREALAWLEFSAARHVHSIAISWNVNATVEEFLQRHRTGARFAALPPQIQELALDKLRLWAETKFGSIDVTFPESRSFEVDTFEF